MKILFAALLLCTAINMAHAQNQEPEFIAIDIPEVLPDGRLAVKKEDYELIIRLNHRAYLANQTLTRMLNQLKTLIEQGAFCGPTNSI
jgi:hypothetical protein